MSSTEFRAGAPAAETGLSPSYVRFALWLLLIVYTLNFLDRQIVNILAHDIEKELGLNDTQIGLLTGLAFALFYTILGIPIARYADKPTSNRPFIIAGSLAVWSGMTALCGIAQNFWQLAAARVGVGIGEAGCTPPAHSLITDYVPREKRSSAMAFYGLGVPAGGLLGMVMGGVLADHYGWRVAFFVAGIPGIVLALAVTAWLREPRLQAVFQAARAAQNAGPKPTVMEVFREIRGSRAFWYIAVATAVVAFLGYGKAVWTTILFQRLHGLSAGETGLWLGLSGGIAGLIGTWAGGYFADRYGRANPRHILTAPAAAMALAAPFLYFGYTDPNWITAMALIFLPGIANALYYGPAFACVQGLVRPQSRAVASALMLFIVNLVGLGLGPLLFGMLSDAVTPWFGKESVRWVLVLAGFLGLIPAVFYYLASLRLARELRKD
jgi:MFS family permease